jgi:hypothetical protein
MFGCPLSCLSSRLLCGARFSDYHPLPVNHHFQLFQTGASYPKVVIKNVKFEDWQLHKAVFDLVISAQAFHWIPASISYLKSSTSPKRRGYVASFGNLSPNLEITGYSKEAPQKLTGTA